MQRSLVVTPRVTIRGEELEWSAVRSTGPGGQNVNRVRTKVELRFSLVTCETLPEAAKRRLRAAEGTRLDAEGRLIIVSQEERSQARNLETALKRLATMIRRSLVAPRQRRPTRPTRGSVERRLDAKKRTADKKRGRRGHPLD